jgi:hypothetical protein
MMTLDEFRREMASYRRDVDEEGNAAKDPWIALEKLRRLYLTFDMDERRMADQIRCEWVLSKDENLRFDALALINDLNLAMALPSLRELALRLPDAPRWSGEMKKVNRLIGKLTKGSPIT